MRNAVHSGVVRTAITQVRVTGEIGLRERPGNEEEQLNAGFGQIQGGHRLYLMRKDEPLPEIIIGHLL